MLIVIRQLVNVLVFVVVIICLSRMAFSAESKQKIISYRCGQNELKVLKIQDGEARRVQVASFDSSNGESSPDFLWAGEFVSLCKNGVFLLLDTNTLNKPGFSFLMSASGQVVARYDFGEVFSFGVADDEKIFWIQAHSVTGKAPVTILRVFSSIGAELLKKSYMKGMVEKVEFGGKIYSIKVTEPDLPG